MTKAKSWKTTACGVIAFLTVLLAQLQALWDASPDTVPDWSLVVAALASLAVALFARDDDVSSEGKRAPKAE